MIEYNYRGQLTDQGTAAGLSIPKLGKSFCLIAVQLHCRALGSWKSRGTKGFWWKRFHLYLGPNWGQGIIPPDPLPAPGSDGLAFPRGQHACMTLLNSKLKPTTFTFFSSWLSCTFLKFLHQVCKLISNSFKILLIQFLNMFLGLMNFSLFLIHI